MKSFNDTSKTAGNVFKALAVTAAALFMASSVAALGFGDSSVDPSEVQAGETVNNQVFNFEVQEVSADGNTDTFYVEFPNELNNSVSANQASFNNASVTSSVQLVDGPDADGVDETFSFATSPTGNDNVTLNTTLDASVDYPDETATYAVKATVEDSSGETSSAQIATVQAGNQDSDDSDSTNNQQETDDRESSGQESESRDADSEDSSDNDGSEAATGDSSANSESDGFFAAIGSLLKNLL